MVWWAAFLVGLVGALRVMREPMEPLTPVVVRDAARRWRDEGIVDYDLRYRMHGSEYRVAVRGGLVTELLVDGRAALTADPGAFSVEGLFHLLELELENLTDPRGPFSGGGHKILARVRFNHKLGYLERYLRTGGTVRGMVIELSAFHRVDGSVTG